MDRGGGTRGVQHPPGAIPGAAVRFQLQRVVLSPLVGVQRAVVARRVGGGPETRRAPPVLLPPKQDEGAVEPRGGGAVGEQR
eukprot:1292064-Prymnesium_polylepis.1